MENMVQPGKTWTEAKIRKKYINAKFMGVIIYDNAYNLNSVHS